MNIELEHLIFLHYFLLYVTELIPTRPVHLTEFKQNSQKQHQHKQTYRPKSVGIISQLVEGFRCLQSLGSTVGRIFL